MRSSTLLARRALAGAASLVVLSAPAGYAQQATDAMAPSRGAARAADGATGTIRSPGDLDALVRQRAMAGQFSGVVLAVRGDSVLYRSSFGFANRAKGIPVRADTRFDVASITKQFTAVAVLRLAQDGRLGLDEPIGKYLSGFDSVARTVTVRQLLQHKSGWGDFLNNPEYAAHPDKFRNQDDYLELVRHLPLATAPGAEQVYSNAGYEVLGGVVEAVTHRKLPEALAQLVFAPAGMKGTDFGLRDAKRDDQAYGYTGAVGSQAVTAARLAPRGSASGGAFSTADDLRRFLSALASNRLLDPKHTAILFNHFDDATAMPAAPRLGAFGGDIGANTAAIYAVTDQGPVTLVVLSNLDPPAAEEVVRAASPWLGLPEPPASRTAMK